MDKITIKGLDEFYRQHLIDQILPFWFDIAVDPDYGGCFTCFENEGKKLISTKKYTWSQGRMLWIYSRLAAMDIFTANDRKYFLHLAQMSAEFLMTNCILENGHCAFLMDRRGKPLIPKGYNTFDISIYADCFVIMGLSMFSIVSGCEKTYEAAKKLYMLVSASIISGSCKTEPYPVMDGYRAHGLLAIFLNVSQEMLCAMEQFKDSKYSEVDRVPDEIMKDILDHFADEHFAVREMILKNNKIDDVHLIGRYINPGHTIESMWFIMHQAYKKSMKAELDKAMKILKHSILAGWDTESGGILLFAGSNGGKPEGSIAGMENYSMVNKIINDWDSKLWWPHSEALYATLLAYSLSKDDAFLQLYQKIHDYTFSIFPNKAPEVKEWTQIRDRQGKPQKKIVALPVKDPFHILRNIILIIDLLSKQQQIVET